MSSYYETKVEVDKRGRRTLYHSTRGGKTWTHPVGEPYMIDWPKRLPCPACEADEALRRLR